MAKAFFLFEDVIGTEFSEKVLVESRVELDDIEPKISVFYRIYDQAANQHILEQEIRFEATNPIWLTSFDPTIALGAYGTCVASKLAHSTYDQVRECYKKAYEDFPDSADMRMRLQATAECLSKSGSSLLSEMKKALKECLGFGLIFGSGGKD